LAFSWPTLQGTLAAIGFTITIILLSAPAIYDHGGAPDADRVADGCSPARVSANR
jgi:hypothetical protein